MKSKLISLKKKIEKGDKRVHLIKMVKELKQQL